MTRRLAGRAAVVAVVVGALATPALVPVPAGAAASEPNRRFVVAAFEDLVGRTPTSSEQQALAARIDAGTSRGTVASELARDPQWVMGVVADLYRTVLEREPDGDGLWYWTLRVGRGERIASLAAQLYASPELYARAGGTDGGYVDLVYLKVLGRAPDAGSRAFWVDRIGRDDTRLPVARSLFLSLEANGRRVDGLYAALLGRAPDAGGRTYWADRLRTIDDVRLAASLVGSPEYFARAQVRPAAAPLEIVVPDPLPEGTVGEPYSVQLQAKGGTPPYRWTRTTDRNDFQVVDGRVFGVPEDHGGPRVTVTDRLGRTVTASPSWVITRPLRFAHRPLPPGVVGAPYRVVLDAAEGTPPYTYEATGLPAGLAFEEGQIVVGVPVAAGQSTLALKVTDANGRVATATHRLTVSAPGPYARITAGQSGSRPFGLSADGTWLLYGNGNGHEDHLPDGYEGGNDEEMFLMHLPTGRVRPLPGDGQSEGDISDDGRYVAFSSRDARLAPGASPHKQGHDVFVWDTTTDAVTRVTAGMSSSNRPRISGNGRYVVYYGDNPFGVVGLDQPSEIYRWDRLTGETLKLTTSKRGLGAKHPDISDDGSVVSFQSYGMLPDDGPGIDAGVWTADTGTAERISVVGGGLYSGVTTRVSGDGSSVFFTSEDQTIGEDGNGWEFDLFVWDHATRTSRITGRPTAGGGAVTTTTDGQRVIYLDVDLTTFHHRLFERDRTTGVDTLLLEADTTIQHPDLSDDGSTFVVQAQGPGPAPGDDDTSYQIYLRRR